VTDPLSGDWCHAPTAAGMQTIACQSCTEMLEAIERSAGGSGSSAEDALSSPSRGTKGSAPIELVRSELQKQKRFPGTYAGPGKGGAPSIYLKEAPPGPAGSSDDRTESTEKMVHPVRRGRGKAAASVRDVEVNLAEEAAGEVAGAAENEVGQNMRLKMEEQRGTTEETPPPEVYRGRRGRGRSAVPARSVGQDVNLEMVAEQAVAGAAGKEEKMEVAQDVAEETSPVEVQTALQAAREEGEEKAVHPQSEDTTTGADVPDPSELAETAVPPAPEAPETADRQTTHPIGENNSYTNSMEDAANALLSIAESGKKRKASGSTKSKKTAEATSPDVGAVPAHESIPADHVDVPPPQKPSAVRAGPKHPATKPAKEALVPRNDAAAECTSPPKKRAASSLAQFNISMQLKGDAAVDGRSPRSAAVESAPNASKSADTKKGAHKATTGASVAPATPAATQKAGDGKKTATPKSAASKTSSKAAPSAAAAAIAAAGLNSSSSSDEEDEQVIQIARRVTRSREGEVLSTRSGKKLVLAGSDLLPGLD
jgi:hypothetical protein